MENNLLSIALSQYGVTEIKGEKHNETIVAYSKDIGYGGIIDDETAWCSIFMNWCAKQADLDRSKKLNARSWLNVGTEVDEPELGDVVVFWRTSVNSWKGHVAIYINTNDDGSINVLGGNQKNMVCIQKYGANRILSYRRLCERKVN